VKVERGSVIVWSNEQIEQWQLRQKWYLEDKTAVTSGKEFNQQRLMPGKR